MSNGLGAREEILRTIRRSLGVNGQERPRVDGARDRLERSPKGLVPERGQLPPAERVALFRAQAEASFATVDEVDTAADVPASVADYLRRNNLPARVRLAPDPRIAAMPWGQTALETSSGRSDGGDLIAVNHAFGGVAETGTLALVSGPDTPTTLNFLPDYAIAVVSAKDIEGAYEQLWDRIRQRYGKGQMPRTVNWVTGPSRSGDIEQTLLLGAHGPRSVHIVVVRD
ncbi:lactate utilization protein [Alsobacter sp. SYSU M60028]|uniref:Lactate utilization protein n=1 Tax=Alsobacter ponti TaxID=2962936 RepID=A0ABT1LCB7_9HYPH|nr:lactate utilization protein [Alsobacter ponti]MCP8939149.1 lactate utilization protein [Alsobacter ponti]